MPINTSSDDPIVLTPHQEGDKVVFSAETSERREWPAPAPAGLLAKIKKWLFIAALIGAGIAIAVLFLTVFLYVILPVGILLFLWGLIKNLMSGGTPTRWP